MLKMRADMRMIGVSKVLGINGIEMAIFSARQHPSQTARYCQQAIQNQSQTINFHPPSRQNQLSISLIADFSALFTEQPSPQSYLILFIIKIIIQTILTMDQNEEVDNNDLIEEAKNRLKIILTTNYALLRWKKLTSASKDRFYRLKELITTQEDYYNDLKTLQEKIKAPLVNNKIVPNKKATQMFNNLQNMIQLSFQMKSQLSKKFQKWDRRTTVIGQTMAIFAKFLLVYSDYFKNLNETQRIMKELSLINPEVRELEKNLSRQNRIVTIDDLLMKPFQRSLKYHLILKDYFAKLDKRHPDYEPLKKAIEIYREVNEKNNNQLQHKEKDQILIDLDSKFGHIIDVEARRYVATYNAFLIQTPITMFVFSDMVLLATKGVEKQHSRITLNKYSLITLSKNQKHYKNGLFLYGVKNCSYLRFEKESERDEVFLEVRNIIKKIYENQHNRQNIMALRITRNSTERNSVTSLQDQPQFARPLICTVVGFEKRKISQDKSHFYFVVEFKASPKEIDFKSSPKQISLLSWQKLLKIQAFILHKYPKIDLFPLNYLPKDLTLQTLSQDQSLKFQLHSISIQIFLNSIFRNHTSLKKVDILCRNLDICDSLWRHMGSSYSQLCFCEFCIKEKYFKSYESYEAEVQKRLYLCQQKKKGKVFVELCEIRTINSQMMITEIPVAQLKKLNSVQRINWLKAKKGLINHTLTNVRPFGPYVNVINLKILFFSIKGEESIVLEVHPNSRIKHIVDRVGKILKFDVSDYTLQMQLGDSKYLLNDDQIIRNVYIEPHEHQSIVSKFFALFTEENFGQKFYLKKIWVLQPALEVSCSFQKLFHEVQDAICRIKSQQLRLSSEQIYSIAAYYFAFTHYLQLDVLNAGMIERKRQQLTLLLPPKYKERKFTAEIMQKIKQIQQNKRISKQDLLKCIIRIICTRPGWSCILFYAVQKSIEGYYIKKVRIGCDFIGVNVINEEAKGNVKYEFKIQDNKWSYKLVGQELIITTPQRQYSFKGRQLWKVKQQIQFYHAYYRNFRKL